MIANQLENIISMGEGYQAEFKLVLPKKTNQLAEEVCAFANAAGGVIIVGLNDDGFPIETEFSNNQKSDIQNVIDNINPQLHCNFQHIPYKGIKVFVIEVPSGDNKPYILNGSIYVRIGPNTKKLTTVEEMRDFFQKADKIFFDETACAGFDITSDVSDELYNLFLEESGITKSLSRQQIFENLKLLDNNNRVKNGAVLFFGTNPQKHFEKAITRCVEFDGKNKRLIIDDKHFAGPIYNQYLKALQWIKGKINLRYDIEGQGSGPRKEIWEIPETVFKEAIINALAHRDYYEKGATTIIEVFNNRIEISNPGGLVSAILPEQFGTKSFSRNPLIFGLFNRMNMVEQVGSGVPRMKSLMTETNLPEPIYNFDGIFSITLQRPVNWAFNREKYIDLLTNNQIKIMDYIFDNPEITIKMLSEKIGISNTAIDNNIIKLKNKGILQRSGSDFKGKWIIVEDSL